MMIIHWHQFVNPVKKKKADNGINDTNSHDYTLTGCVIVEIIELERYRVVYFEVDDKGLSNAGYF